MYGQLRPLPLPPRLLLLLRLLVLLLPPLVLALSPDLLATLRLRWAWRL